MGRQQRQNRRGSFAADLGASVNKSTATVATSKTCSLSSNLGGSIRSMQCQDFYADLLEEQFERFEPTSGGNFTIEEHGRCSFGFGNKGLRVEVEISGDDEEVVVSSVVYTPEYGASNDSTDKEDSLCKVRKRVRELNGDRDLMKEKMKVVQWEGVWCLYTTTSLDILQEIHLETFESFMEYFVNVSYTVHRELKKAANKPKLSFQFIKRPFNHRSKSAPH